jgi:short-subunit dehydrogenase
VSESQRSEPSSARARLIDRTRFGPWALVTGASSGIGREFARQIASHGIHVVLASRRVAELEALGREVRARWGVEHRVVEVDLSRPDALATIDASTRDLDIGLVVSNAGAAKPGDFLEASRDEMHATARLNVLAHLDLAHHFGRKLAARKRGGLLLVGALGASDGVPFMAHTAATKAYVHSLGQSLHVELGKRGVSVTVLMPGPTNTPALAELGIDDPPMKPLSTAQCVDEALRALDANRATIVPGRLVRLIVALVPASIARSQTAKMFEAALSAKHASVPTATTPRAS